MSLPRRMHWRWAENEITEWRDFWNIGRRKLRWWKKVKKLHGRSSRLRQSWGPQTLWQCQSKLGTGLMKCFFSLSSGPIAQNFGHSWKFSPNDWSFLGSRLVKAWPIVKLSSSRLQTWSSHQSWRSISEISLRPFCLRSKRVPLDPSELPSLQFQFHFISCCLIVSSTWLKLESLYTGERNE